MLYNCSCVAYDVSDVNNLTWLENDEIRTTLNVTSCTRWYHDDSQYKSTIVTLVSEWKNGIAKAFHC